ncbi:MAG: hypothetical protein IPG04_08985 [Polyangiaceae bacterium]|nr:hypothetical protein [Polyangiaceae bacterium]
MTSLRDLLELPAAVTKSAFVVRLAEAVTKPDVLLDTYAITPDIHHALDRALGLVSNAVTERRNDAAFIHGSFGSGKSHFMAVLSLLCANDARAWREPRLHDLVEKHAWVKTHEVLRLHINMIDAQTLGDALFKAYLDRMRKERPEAPIAPLFADGALFDNAKSLRAQLGDDAFFAKLNEGSHVDARWGKKAAEAWGPARFADVLASGDPKVRGVLFSALVKSHFPAFASQSAAYLGFEDGMAAMARHAGELGHKAIVLFLDELVLWLATKASSPESLNDEIAKLAKLVEGQAADQAIPIVTFAARQRDIGEMVGEQYAGHDAQTVRDKLKFWEGRFNTIPLPDKDLPAIIEKRVVQPKGEAAKKQLDAAFDAMRRGLGSAWGTLLGDIGDEPGFRRVYPFSPALVEALVAMSHYLQRERTALKILVEMLVGQMADFEIGKVVPVGDLYDALAEGEEPMDGTMRQRFASAKRIYDSELLPVIQRENKTGSPDKCQRLRNDAATVGCANCRETRCRNDNRLAKTLLLAALAPSTPVFRALTASRLVQLNHGTLRSPVPGAEATLAAQRLRTWASEIGKLRLTGQEDPQIVVVLEGVDVKPIIQAAAAYDTVGARRSKLREILFDQLELESDKPTVEKHKVHWRGTERLGTLHFGNVREMDDAMLRAADDEAYRVVIDYPFDDPGHAPQEDEARVVTFLETNPQTPTIVWLPSFLSDAVLRDLGELCVIDRILEGDTWKQHLANLRPDDQVRAREELTSKAQQKRDRLRRALDSAYGLQKAEAGTLDPTREVSQHLIVLRPDARIHPPTAANLGQGLKDAIDQLLRDRWARHPEFTEKVTKGKLEKELEYMQRLCESEGQRLPLAKNEAGALDFADKLGLVAVRDGQATLKAETYDDLDRQLQAQNIAVPEVSRLHRLFDPGGVKGLTREVQDFVVAVYATVRGREIARAGSPIATVTLGKLEPDAELLAPRLPDEASWHKAVDRAGKLFGISVGRARTPKNLRKLTHDLTQALSTARANRAGEVASLLAARANLYGKDAARLTTAVRVSDLLAELHGRDAVGGVEVLAAFEPATSEAAMQRHLIQAGPVSAALANDVLFTAFPALAGRPDDSEATRILREVAALLAADEINQPLVARLQALSIEAQQLLQRNVKAGGGTSIGEVVATASAIVTPARVTVRSAEEIDRLADVLKSIVADGETIEIDWRRVR